MAYPRLAIKLNVGKQGSTHQSKQGGGLGACLDPVGWGLRSLGLREGTLGPEQAPLQGRAHQLGTIPHPELP